MALRVEHHAGYRTAVGPYVSRRQIAMKFAGGGAHGYPVEWHPFAGLTRYVTIALRLRDHWKGQRIDEASQAVWIEGRDHRRRVTPHGLGESPRGDCGCGSNHRLTKKSAASSQAINLHGCGPIERGSSHPLHFLEKRGSTFGKRLGLPRIR